MNKQSLMKKIEEILNNEIDWHMESLGGTVDQLYDLIQEEKKELIAEISKLKLRTNQIIIPHPMFVDQIVSYNWAIEDVIKSLTTNLQLNMEEER